jgi:uncharacterized protein (TIGR03067 family)
MKNISSEKLLHIDLKFLLTLPPNLMNRFLFCLSLFCLISCATTKKTTVAPNPLNGTWLPIQQEMGGKAIPATFFANQKLILSDTNYTFIAESIDKGVVTIQGNKMDIYGKEGVNAGNHFKAIYKLENDQLTICYNLGGEIYPAMFDSSGNPVYFLSVFKRE